MDVTYETGFAIEKDVEVVVNSANGLLLADSSGAAAIREASEDLTETERYEFDQLFNSAPLEIQDFFEKKRLEHGWYYHHENLSCLKLLAYNKYEAFEVGTALYDPLWSEKSTKKVIHIITLSYNPKTGERIKGTPELIEKAIGEAIEIALDFRKKTIAIPIPCARPDYGLNPKTSFAIVKKALAKFEDEDISITLCFDNNFTEALLKEIKS